MLLLAAYVLTGLFTRILEDAGVYRCGCDPNCWCKRPGLSVFRWVFPRGHRISRSAGDERLLDA